MVDTADLLGDVFARLDALERENHALRTRLSQLEQLEERPVSMDAPATTPGVLNRRSLLGRAAQAAAAVAAAGVLVGRETQEANASHSSATVDALHVIAHYVGASNESGSFAIHASNNSNPSFPTIASSNEGSGAAVYARSAAGIGVSSMGVVGVHGYGDQTGVRGDGKTGVYGKGVGGPGVSGESPQGYGVVCSGGRAPLRLVPPPSTSATGKPTTGSHQVGELYLDKAGSLFVCTVGGKPGTWRKVNTTLV